MPIKPIPPIPPVIMEQMRQKEAERTEETPGFGDMLKQAVNDVNALAIDASRKNMQLALGEIKDVHEVMIALEKSGLAMSLTLEIRNRALEAYQSIMRLSL